jgi:hypothetical protein
MAGKDGGEGGIAARRENGDAVADGPDDDAGDPLLQAKADRGSERAIDDG